MKMKILDLFCGMGGWVQSFPSTWKVIGYDIKDFSDMYPFEFVKCDLLKFSDFPSDIDLIVASPPCTDFSKASLPQSWKSVKLYPPDIDEGMKLFNRAREIIDTIKPRYHIIENVRGAQKFVGKSDWHIGSRYFWSNFKFEYTGNGNDIYGKTEISPGKNRAELRAKIPYSVSYSLYNFLTGMMKGD